MNAWTHEHVNTWTHQHPPANLRNEGVGGDYCASVIKQLCALRSKTTFTAIIGHRQRFVLHQTKWNEFREIEIVNSFPEKCPLNFHRQNRSKKQKSANLHIFRVSSSIFTLNGWDYTILFHKLLCVLSNVILYQNSNKWTYSPERISNRSDDHCKEQTIEDNIRLNFRSNQCRKV